MIYWIAFDLLPFFPPAVSEKAAPLFDMMNRRSEIILGISLMRAMPMEEIFAPVGSSDPDDPQAQQKLSDEWLKIPGIRFDVDQQIVYGTWLDKDAPAQTWKMKQAEEKYGLYDASGKVILASRYDAIERFCRFPPSSRHQRNVKLHPRFRIDQRWEKRFCRPDG